MLQQIRRERGRLAQRAFRQRQIDTIRELRRENLALREAVSAICNAVPRGRSTLDNAIRHAQQLIDAHPSEASPITSEADRIQFGANSHSEQSIQHLTGHNGVENSHQHGPNEQSEPPLWVHPGVFPGNPPFDADRHITITGAPPDIIPYLGAAAYSVAGQIHWVTMAYSYSAIKALRSTNPPPEARGYATKIFGEVLRRVTVDGLFEILHGRLMYRRNGFMTGHEHPARDPSLGRALMLSVIEQCAPTPKWCYLTSFNVADRLSKLLGSEFTRFEETLSGKSSERRSGIMRKFMRELASAAFCYGDGPRWSPENVASIARQWLLETNAP